MWRKRGGGGFELKTPSNRASRLKGYDAPAVNGPAASRKAGSGITLWAINSLVSSDGFETVHESPAVTVPAVLANVAINLSTQVPM